MTGLAIPKALKHANITASHRHAPKQEKAVATRLGGKRVPGSGSGSVKGDVRVKNILRVECKGTAKKSFTVTREMVEKIEAAALASGELPAIEIAFLDEKGRATHTLAIVPTYVLDLVVEAKRGTSSKPIKSDTTPISVVGEAACIIDQSTGGDGTSGALC